MEEQAIATTELTRDAAGFGSVLAVVVVLALIVQGIVSRRIAHAELERDVERYSVQTVEVITPTRMKATPGPRFLPATSARSPTRRSSRALTVICGAGPWTSASM